MFRDQTIRSCRRFFCGWALVSALLTWAVVAGT